MTDDAATERARINAETAQIAWRELQRFFAQGKAIAVATELDLVEVAYQMSLDNEAQLRAWKGSGKIMSVSDELATEWFEANVLVWAVVVRPWILVQPVRRRVESSRAKKG